MTRVLVGEIVKGKGEAGGFFADPLYERAMGVRLHPGTLNLLIPDPRDEYRFFHQDLGPREVRIAGKLRYCPCTLNGDPAFILATWPGATHRPTVFRPGHVLFEIAAEKRLPGVDYGAQGITVAYDPGVMVTRPLLAE